MGDSDLYLIGTVHLDLDGERRLNDLLNKLSPSIIALEFNKDREDMQLLNLDEEQKEINDVLHKAGLDLSPEQVKTLIEYDHRINDVTDYEWRSSRDYVRRNPDSRLEYIDISIFANGKEEFTKGYIELRIDGFKLISEVPELTNQFLEVLNNGWDSYKEYLMSGVQLIYSNAKKMALLFEEIRNYVLSEKMDGLSDQEVQVLKQIYNPQRDEAMASNIRRLYGECDGRLVAIVGLGHLEGLRVRLGDLRPRVMTLAEYDSIP